MTGANNLAAASSTFDRSLESAVSSHWGELVSNTTPTAIHVAYHRNLAGMVEYLKFWACEGKGDARLVCEYWNAALWAHDIGFAFANGYCSARFAGAIETIMKGEGAIAVPGDSPLVRDGLLQIIAPAARASALPQTRAADPLAIAISRSQALAD